MGLLWIIKQSIRNPMKHTNRNIDEVRILKYGLSPFIPHFLPWPFFTSFFCCIILSFWAFANCLRMRSSLVVRASDCQCTSCNGPGFDPSIRRHSGIWGAADETVLNIVRKKNPPKIWKIVLCFSCYWHVFSPLLELFCFSFFYIFSVFFLGASFLKPMLTDQSRIFAWTKSHFDIYSICLRFCETKH